MQVKTKRRLLITGILFFSVVIMAALTMKRPMPPKRPSPDTTMLVETLNLETQDVQFEISSQGTVKPRTETVLSAEVSGSIVEIADNFIAGGVFKAGDVLMRIDDTDYRVAVEQADALVKQRQIEYNGAKSLSNKGYRAEAELASAKASLAAAEASLVKAKKNLERTVIRVPYTGMVKAKSADIGQYVNPGSRLGEVFAIDRAEIRLPLTDQDLAFVSLPKASFEGSSEVGPVVTLSSIQKGQRQEWQARIIRTEGIVDERSRVTYAVASIEDPYSLLETSMHQPLPIGSFVSANISGDTFSNVIKVPRSAVRGKNELMFVDSDSRLQIKEVNVLRADQDYAYLTQGAEPGERITLTSIESPINGMKLRTLDDIQEAEAVAGGTDSKEDSSQVAKIK